MGITIPSRGIRTLESFAQFFSDQSEDDSTFELEIPEDLSTLSDANLAELHTRAVEAFNALYGDGKDVPAEILETLSALTEAIEVLSTEKDTRETLAIEQREKAASMAAKVNGKADESASETLAAEEEESEEDKEKRLAAEAAAKKAAQAAVEPEQLATRRSIRLPKSSSTARAAAQSQQLAAERGIRDIFRIMGADLGVTPGTGVDFSELGEALNTRLKSFNVAQYQNAARQGRALRDVGTLAVLNRDFAPELTINNNDREHIEAVIREASKMSRMKAAQVDGRGSLVASGGWQGISETLYNQFLALEASTGDLSVPEVVLARGGAQVSETVTFAQIFAAVGFDYTEQNDLEGRYQTDTTVPLRAPSTAYPLEEHVRFADGSIYRVTVAGTTGAGAEPATPAIGATVVDGTVTFLRVARALLVGPKPSYHIGSPRFTEYRLDVYGLIIEAGLLGARGYPEFLADIIRKALIAHFHKLNAAKIAEIAAGSTAVAMTAGTVGAVAPLLKAIELQAEHMRDTHRMDVNAKLELVIPNWVKGALRTDLAQRLGVDLIGVSDARLVQWMTDRNVSVQFVQDYQSISTTAPAAFTAWPASVQFLLYPAGTWVAAKSDIITIDTLYDSTNLKNNDFTALFTEEGQKMLKIGPDSRKVTTPLSPTGVTHRGAIIAADGTATA